MKVVPAILASLIFAFMASASVQLATQRGSATSPAVNGGGMSLDPIVSADGRYVVFASTANNFVLTTNNTPLTVPPLPVLNVYLRDRASNTTTLVSIDLAGTGGGDADSLPTGLSTNGQFILFESTADNLAPGTSKNINNVFVRDLVNSNTILVSVNTNGVGGNGSSSSEVMTPDGRYVAFSSVATDLVPGDTNGIADVFVRDLQAGTTRCASAGAISQGSYLVLPTSDTPAISADGRYVAFYSSATNLVPGLKVAGEVYVYDLVASHMTWASSGAQSDYQSLTGLPGAISCAPTISADGSFVAFLAGTNANARAIVLRYCLTNNVTDLVNTNAGAPSASYQDTPSPTMTSDGRFIASIANVNGSSGDTAIFLWDAETGTNVLISANAANALPTGTLCESPVISSDGQYVAFLCLGPGLTTNAAGGTEHVYLRNVAAQTTVVADVDTNGVPSGVDDSADPALTADGQSVVFASPNSNLVPGDGNRDYDVFLFNAAAGTMELISARNPLLPCVSAAGLSQLSAAPLSQDGRFLAFASDANDLVAGDTNQVRDVFVRDLLTGSNVMASVNNSGACGNSLSYDPAIDGAGRYVAFTSAATNLVSGAANGALQIYLRDLQANTTTLVSVNSTGTGPGNGDSTSAAISADGSLVMFTSQASNLVAGVSAGTINLYLRNPGTGKTSALTTSGMVCGAMTPDGHFIAFTDTAGSTAGKIYVWDTQLGKRVATNIINVVITSVAISPDGNRLICTGNNKLSAVDRAANQTWTLATGYPHSSIGLRFSADSRYVTYGLAPTAAGTNQVYLYDLQNQTNVLVSHAVGLSSGADGASDSPDISADGRFVIYRSAADNLVAGDTNGVPDVFLYDAVTGGNMLLSSGAYGSVAGNNRSLTPVFSADGQLIVFCSWASDLVAEDFNQTSDVFAFALLYASVTTTNGGSPTISWPASLSQNYIIEYKDTLGDANWRSLPGTVTVIGDRAYLTDGTLTAGQRFYRVRPAN